MRPQSPKIPWLYDEHKHVGVNFDDPAVVARYDAAQGTSLEHARKTVAEFGILEDNVVVEFGPGTGAFAIAAAHRGARVIAVDVSVAMLEFARRAAALANVESRLTFHHGGFLNYEHRTEPADFVVSEFAFHHLPDFWKAIALGRIFEMLKPGGQFILRDVVFSFPPQQYVAQVGAWIDDVCGDGSNGWSRSEFEMHVRDEYSTFAWVLEEMIRRAGFTIDRAEYASPTYALYRCVRPATVA